MTSDSTRRPSVPGEGITTTWRAPRVKQFVLRQRMSTAANSKASSSQHPRGFCTSAVPLQITFFRNSAAKFGKAQAPSKPLRCIILHPRHVWSAARVAPSQRMKIHAWQTMHVVLVVAPKTSGCDDATEASSKVTKTLWPAETCEEIGGKCAKSCSFVDLNLGLPPLRGWTGVRRASPLPDQIDPQTDPPTQL